MKRELKIAIIMAVLFFAAFIFLVKYTENINNSNIINNKADVYQGYSMEQTISYQKSKVNLWLCSTGVSFVVPLLFIASGFSAALRQRLQQNYKSAFLVIVLFFAIYSLVSYIISLPLEYYGGYVLKHSYGLSNQELFKWLNDSFKGFMINTAMGAAAVWGLYMLIRRVPHSWWLYAGLLSIPVLFFLTFVTPVYIDPLFNKYVTMKNPPLEASIRQELKTAGVSDCQVYMVDKSVDTKEMNAYMTGVFSTKRIVLWDTTVNSLTSREVLSVTAHEIGHYVLGHIWKAIILGGALTIIILFLANKGTIWVLANSGGAFGVNTIKDIASLPLIILLLNLLLFAAAPGINAYTRYTEREADRFELELTRDNEAAITSTLKLHQGSLIISTPGIIYKLWNYDHPTFQERIDFAASYSPWKFGQPLKYEKYFRNR